MSKEITPEEFDASMNRLGVRNISPKVAIAVSGGGDSLALAMLMRDWVKNRGGDMLALTVDHGLRPESATEVVTIAQLMRTHDIAHSTLVWPGDKPSTHIQERARIARYNLLLKACRQHGFPVLAIAHNLEDQIETFWMRLAHGSGLDGLSAMAPVRDIEGISVIRPLLPFSREQLRTTCARYQLNWIEDPSNQNRKYLRARLRQFENLLAEEGLTPARLSQTLQKLEEARQALQAITEQAMTACVQEHAEGYATLRLNIWKEFPHDLQRRILGQALMLVVAHPYPIGFDLMEQTCLDLHNPAFAGKTLAGCEIIPGKNGHLFIVREAGAIEGRVKANEGMIWDGRFIISGIRAEAMEIGALGSSGLSELRKNMTHESVSLQKLEALPFRVKLVLPALWQGENLIAVPNVGYYSQDCPQGLQTGIITMARSAKQGRIH